MIAGMSEVDFYEVRGSGWEVALCRLIEQVYGQGLSLYVWADSEADARRLDNLLWTFREDSFVPHALWQGEPRVDEPVVVGWQAGNPNHANCLVLARNASCEEVQYFERVLDLAPVDLPHLRNAARARYRAFRESGFAVRFHPADS
jgi:DNA polymerase-3 subunit chi